MNERSGLRVGIVGAGLMGAGLARLFSAAGWRVGVSDPDAQARARLEESVTGLRTALDMRDVVADADLVIEAAPERLGLKQEIFAELARTTRPDVPLATNSSVIAVGAISAKLSDLDAARVIGMHFWNPPDLIPLVEVIQGPRTDPRMIAGAMTILHDLGREPVHVHLDTVPGNRLQHALWREAMALVDEGVCSPEDVDRIVKRSFGLRLPVLGPLENADLVGLELTEAIHRVVLPTLSRAIAPADGLKQRLAQGEAGVAAGRGFYADWTPGRVQALRERLDAHLRRMLG